MLKLAKKTIRESWSLPPPPELVVELSAIMRSDAATAADFEALLSRDASITEALLRLANTYYFQTRREIRSVRQAIAFLGTDRVFELALGAWLIVTLPYRVSGYDISAKSLWLHGVATGILAERLARVLNLEVPDVTFAAGLMHDIGKLAVGDLIASLSDTLRREVYSGGTSFFAAEKRRLGTDHAEVGGLLCDEWRLPNLLSWVVRWHHTPNEALNESKRDADITLLDLIHLANGLAHSLGFGADMGDLSRTVQNESMERLLLDKGTIDRVVGETLINAIWEIGDLVGGGISC